MPHYLPVTILLFILPALYFAQRFQLLTPRLARWGLAGAILIALAYHLPYQGLPLVMIKRSKLLLLALVVLLLLQRRFRLGFGRSPRTYLGGLAVLAVLSHLTYLNFFAFHGNRNYIHYHDTAHYYLGSKYFDELSYDGLYTAMLRAEVELYDNQLMTRTVRDLRVNRLVSVQELLPTSDEVKAGFSADRWAEFRQDVAYFRERLGPKLATFYLDQGFNPTPFWALMGRTVAGLVPAGSHTGIILITLIDQLLVVGVMLVILWAFGLESMLLSVIYFSLAFGASFSWTGGAFLRFPWLFCLVGALCCYRRRRAFLAGTLLAGASLLRIFPALFAIGVLAQAAGSFFRNRTVAQQHRRFLAGCLVTGVLLLASTGMLADRYSSWAAFAKNSKLYADTVAPNFIGLTRLLTYDGRPRNVTAEEFQEIQHLHARVYRWQLATAFLASLIAVVVACQRRSDIDALVIGFIPVFTGLNLAAYYYVMLLILIPVPRGCRDRVVLLFTGELFVFTLLLFEEADAMVFLYRCILVLLLLAAVFLPRAKAPAAVPADGRDIVPE